MKEIEVIDLILEDVNKFLINQGINPLKVDLLQRNGIPYKCDGELTKQEKDKINDHLETYRNDIKILELIRDFKFGSKAEMNRELEKNHVWERYINMVKNNTELMDYLGAEFVIKLKK